MLDKAEGLATGDVRKDIVKLSGYLKANFSGLKTHPEMDNAGLSTGAIEGNIDKFIARRMKHQGMSWSIQGIRRMLWLRVALYDNKLDDYLYTETDKPESYKLPPQSGANNRLIKPVSVQNIFQPSLGYMAHALFIHPALYGIGGRFQNEFLIGVAQGYHCHYLIFLRGV